MNQITWNNVSGLPQHIFYRSLKDIVVKPDNLVLFIGVVFEVLPLCRGQSPQVFNTVYNSTEKVDFKYRPPSAFSSEVVVGNVFIAIWEPVMFRRVPFTEVYTRTVSSYHTNWWRETSQVGHVINRVYGMISGIIAIAIYVYIIVKNNINTRLECLLKSP